MDCSSDSELRLIIIGKTGTGKSSTANSILQKKLFTARPSGSSVTKVCQFRNEEIFGKNILIVDTPGLYDTNFKESETLKEIFRSIAMVAPGPHAILFIMQIGRCTEEEINTINKFMTHFGDHLQKYIITIFTRYDDWKRDRDDSFDNYIDTLPQDAVTFINETCNRRYVPFDNALTGFSSEQQTRALIQTVDEMVVRNGGTCYSDENFRAAERIRKDKEEEALHALRKIQEQHEIELKKQFEQQLEEEKKIWKEDVYNREQEYRKQTEEILKAQRESLMKEMEFFRSRNEPNGGMNTMINGIKIVSGLTDTVNSLLGVWDKTHIHESKGRPPAIHLPFRLGQQHEFPCHYQSRRSIFNYADFLEYSYPKIGNKNTSDGDVD